MSLLYQGGVRKSHPATVISRPRPRNTQAFLSAAILFQSMTRRPRIIYVIRAPRSRQRRTLMFSHRAISPAASAATFPTVVRRDSGRWRSEAPVPRTGARRTSNVGHVTRAEIGGRAVRHPEASLMLDPPDWRTSARLMTTRAAEHDPRGRSGGLNEIQPALDPLQPRLDGVDAVGDRSVLLLQDPNAAFQLAHILLHPVEFSSIRRK